MTDQITAPAVQVALPALSLSPVSSVSSPSLVAGAVACLGCGKTIPAIATFCAYCGESQAEVRTAVDAPAFGTITVPVTTATTADALRAAVAAVEATEAEARAAQDEEDEEARLDPLYLKGLDTADDLARPRRCRLSPSWHTWGAPTRPRCAVNQCERCSGKVTLTLNKETGVYRATHSLPNECWPARVFDGFAPQSAGLPASR